MKLKKLERKKYILEIFALVLVITTLVRAYIDIREIIKLQTVEKKEYQHKTKWVKSDVIEMLAYKAIKNDISPRYLIALANCESGASTTIQSRHMQPYGREQSFGLFQIHTRAHKDITPEMAKDPIFNTEWTIKEIKKGKAPQHWVTCHKKASQV